MPIAAEESESLATPGEGVSGTLEGDHLPLWKATAFGLAAMQVGPGLGYSAAYLYGIAGNAAPLCLSVALLVALAVAACIVAHARQHVVSGSLMSYALFSLGPVGRLIAGAALMLAYVTAMTSNTAVSAVFWTGTMVDLGVQGLGGVGFQLGVVTLVTVYASVMAYRGIDASVRMSLLLAYGCVPVVASVLIVGITRGGVLLGNPFVIPGLSSDRLIDGATVALGFYIGFDGVTALAAETKNPKVNVPRALYWCLFTLGASLVMTCVMQGPFILAHPRELELGVSPLAIVGRAGGATFLSTLGDILITLACIASTIGFANYGSRVIATAAHDGLLPEWMAAIHKRHRSPYAAVILQGVVGVILPFALAIPFHTSPIELAVYTTNVVVYLWIIPYALMCIGTIVLQFKERRWNAIELTAAVAGALVCAYLIVHSLQSNSLKEIARWTYLALIATIAACWAMTRRRKLVAPP